MAGDVDVVVTTHNAYAVVARCLDALRGAPIATLVVVDNASSDETAETLHRTHPEAQVVRLEEHTGLARAYNRGSALGGAPYVLFLNDDVFAGDAGAVAHLAQTLASHPAATSAAGRLVEADTGETQDKYLPRRFPTPLSMSVRLAGIDLLWARNPGMGFHMRSELDDATTKPVPQPAGACLLVRRAALEAVGGWDERYAFWLEDVDLVRRLATIGPALYVPSAAFRHIGGATVNRWSRAQAHWRTYHGVLHYAEAHFARRQQVMLGCAVYVIALLRLLAAAPARPELAGVYKRVLAGAVALARARPLPALKSRCGESSQ